MDLFTEQSPIADQVGWWKHVLPPSTLLKIEHILKEVDEQRKTSTIYPEKDDVLRIFREIQLNQVKVVIIGQDPYHDGNANGVAFGCKYKASPSLISIVKAIIADVGTDKTTYDRRLQHLVQQGVFLINTMLTVKKGTPRSHSGLGWQDVTKDVIKTISDKGENIVFMLWGNDALINFDNLINRGKHLVLKAEHPVAAAYNKKNWLCNHFSLANTYLQQSKQTPITWL